MTTPRDPWADPDTSTVSGTPSAGPPATVQGAPYGYGPPQGWGQQPYGSPGPYGPPWPAPGPPAWPAPWSGPWPPQGPPVPRKPAQVIVAAVLTFLQALVVLGACLSLWTFASMADFLVTGDQATFAPGPLGAMAREGTVLTIVQLLSALLLVGAGIWALTSRRPAAGWLLVTANTVQIALAVYWLVRLIALAERTLGPGHRGAFAWASVYFLPGPLTAVVLLLVGPGRHWFRRPA